MDNTLLEQAKEIISKPYYITALAAISGTAITTISSIYHEINESKRIPLAYSEIEQLTNALYNQENTAKEITIFLSNVNDLCMQVFESYNDSFDKTIASNDFAERLKYRYSNINHGSTISDLASTSTSSVEKLKDKLQNQIITRDKLDGSMLELHKSWDESHDDVYHTEIYYTTSRDSKGNVTTQMHTRQVYDYTWHEYTYNKEAGNRADNMLIEMFNTIPKLDSPGQYLTITKISDSEKESALKSRARKKLPEEELNKLPGMWHDGTLHDEHLEEIVEEYSALNMHSKQWHKVKDNAKEHYRYKTYSSSDSGPEEYQVATNALDTASSIYNKINGFIEDINTVSVAVPKLISDIQKYLNVADYVKYNPNEKLTNKDKKLLEKKIINNTKELYSNIFEEGIDTDRFKGWRIALFSSIGLAAGAGIGQLIEYLNHNTM